MRKRQAALLAVVVAVLPAVLFGSGSFSSVAGDRPVAVAVTDDDDAYLGAAVDETEGSVGGDPVRLLVLTDRLPGDLTLEGFDVRGDSSFVDFDPSPGRAGTDIGGPDDPLVIEATCRSVGTATLEFVLSARSQGTSVQVERSATVVCTEAVSTPTEKRVGTASPSETQNSATASSVAATTETVARTAGATPPVETTDEPTASSGSPTSTPKNKTPATE